MCIYIYIYIGICNVTSNICNAYYIFITSIAATEGTQGSHLSNIAIIIHCVSLLLLVVVVVVVIALSILTFVLTQIYCLSSATCLTLLV